MSGIPGMGQRWQAALKIRVTMIPLPENTAAGAASGVCCSGKGCCRVSGSHAGRSLHIPSHTGGRENYKSMAGYHARLWRVGITFLWKRDFRYREKDYIFGRKAGHIHIL